MPYYRRHMNMDAHRYVRADVVSEWSLYGTPFYTHHKNMDYVCVDVLSDYSSYWISFYTLHKYTGTHPRVYHRNNCIQHFVHEAVHSLYPEKTQRLSIRIYSDRKNNYILKCYMKCILEHPFEQLRKLNVSNNFSTAVNHHTPNKTSCCFHTLFWMNESHVHTIAEVNRFFKNLEAISKTYVSGEWNTGSS